MAPVLFLANFDCWEDNSIQTTGASLDRVIVNRSLGFQPLEVEVLSTL